ncbi:hypothetical protein CLV31_10416 [Algoriphagus aquaeductus]|uniref:Uncharacterized protein n=1 Tax=Algoriphagus aquaeductus TaxID=475299 RepID=A0A326RT43_9BACT|nr:hypothetical protein [Algoriphagus aquaeductus]PZV84368.1 hypothetical protein CLV31_10416 [Algoriphagus aquaeductus]
MAKLFFSRYTITSGGQYTDKFDFLLNGLKNEASTTYRSYVYRFFDTEVLEVIEKYWDKGIECNLQTRSWLIVGSVGSQWAQGWLKG